MTQKWDINSAVMERYRKAVTIEMTADDTVHVTLNGDHTINDADMFVLAVIRIYERWPNLERAVRAHRERKIP